MIKFLNSNNSLYVFTKKSLINNVFISLFSLFVIASLNGCVKGGAITNPVSEGVVITNSFIANLTTTTAQSGGILTYNGGGTILEAGVCYSSGNQTPTVANAVTVDTLSFDVAGTKTFTSHVTGLSPSTTYYLRAYATNSAGTAYGAVIKFTTSSTIISVSSTVSTLAGSIAGGYLNGTGTGALFNNPQSVVADASGNVYVADDFNNVIRKITPGGAVTTYAGDGNAGYTDGAAATAEFYAPQGLGIDSQGDIFVADLGNNRIRKISAAGVVSTYAGNGIRGYVNGADTVAEFNNPQNVCVDAIGNVYVADKNNNLIRKINTSGVVSTLAGYYGEFGLYNATGTNAVFNAPNAVAVDSKGNVYVADTKNYCIRKITSAGVVTTLLGGSIQTTLIGTPSSVAIDTKDNLYIADESGRIIEFSTTGGIVYILGGTANTLGYVDGAGASALFNNPQGVTVDSQGNVYVADYGNNVIRKIVTSL
jgi:sugar lactone lactonase YvrE